MGRLKRGRLWALSIQPKERQHFQNFQREETSWGIPKFSQISSRKSSSHSTNFAPGISRIFGWIVRISKIQQLSEFLETFPGNFCTVCRCFQIFESFGCIESAPSLRSLPLAFLLLITPRAPPARHQQEVCGDELGGTRKEMLSSFFEWSHFRISCVDYVHESQTCTCICRWKKACYYRLKIRVIRLH